MELREEINKLKESPLGNKGDMAADFWSRLKIDKSSSPSEKEHQKVINAMHNAVSTEQKDRHNKEQNLLIMGLPESTNSNDEERQTNAIEQLKEIFDKLNIDETKVRKYHRFDKKQNSIHTSIVKFQLNKSEDRFVILNAAKELRNKGEKF